MYIELVVTRRRNPHRFLAVLSSLLVVLWAGIGGSLGAWAGVFRVPVFTSGTEGYHTFRIPAIVRAANGDLLAFAEGRRNSSADHGDVDLVMKRSRDHGLSWSPLELVQDAWDAPTADITIGNPAPVVDGMDPQHPGRIWLPFCRNNDQVFVTYSDDHGGTWSESIEITSSVKDPAWGWYATGPIHGIQIQHGPHAGRLIIPSDHRVSGVDSWGSHVVYSDDHGQTWQLGAVDTHLALDPIHPNENVAVELVDGRIYFNAREHQGTSPGNRAVAYSSDGGLTYDASFADEPNIETPVVQNSAIRFASTIEGDGQNILIYSSPGQWDERADMTIRVSLDEGMTWGMETIIHPGSAAYSDLIQSNSEQIGILYEVSNYQQIIFGYFDYEDLDPAPWNGIEGDIDQNGILDESDLDAYIAVWAPITNEYYLGGIDSYSNGDLNFDGKNDLDDVYLMRRALLAAGLSAAPLAALMAGVPEPSSMMLFVLLAVASWMISLSLTCKRGG